MSPEQARGEMVDRQSDLFALGLIFYEMLAGARPFRGRSVAERLGAVLRDDPVPLPGNIAGLPPDIEIFPAVPGEVARPALPVGRRCGERSSRWRPRDRMPRRYGRKEDRPDGVSGSWRRLPWRSRCRRAAGCFLETSRRPRVVRVLSRRPA
ncbi:MAG: hypothetical protein H0W08_15340 [Acidobacteria bacterium]|nr:hypothetical protein [Acidobacteriota bacterium]